MKPNANNIQTPSPSGIGPLRKTLVPKVSAAGLLLACFALLPSNLLHAQEQRRSAPTFIQPGAAQTTNSDKLVAAMRSASAPTPSSVGMETLDNKHKLTVGDQVSIRILEDDDPPKTLAITDSGDIEAPYIGRRPAEGKTCRELALKLKAELERQYYYQATVIVSVDVMAKSRGRVYLVGPIRVPGPQDIPSDETFTLSKAVLRAGGFTDFANQHHVKVTRPAKGAGGRDQTFVVDVANILEKGNTETDLILEPGDMIYVPDRLIRF